jgi:diguanylate cyclase (GGDEF)-like protein/PAS domain S-box-containing protein
MEAGPMKLRWKISGISDEAVALLAILFGIGVGIWLTPTTLLNGVLSHPFAASSIRLVECAVGGSVVVGLVVIQSLMGQQLRIERDLLAAFLKYIPDNVFFKDRDSRFIRISWAMATYLGLQNPAQAEKKTDSDMFSSEHAEQAFADEQEIIRTGQAIVGKEEKETWPDGREGWVRTSKVPLHNRKGQIIGTMGISSDITDRKRSEARIQHMALHDALTGLPNRVLLQDRLEQAIAFAVRNQKRVALLMLDLDRFKNVNDSRGHHVGDRLLEVVSNRLKECLRKSDTVARFGGDEFVVCLPMVRDDEEIKQVAQKILAAMVEPFLIEGHELQISGSIGICQYPTDGKSPEALLQFADAAMYQAKTKGRGNYCFFTQELNEDAKRRHKLEEGLHRACERGEFVLNYQPQVATDSSCLKGAEALLRWHHPEEGLISPTEFIPLLEELGLMAEVGTWVLRTACFQNAAWQKEGLPPIRMAVNVSAQQFHRGEIVRTVEETLRETRLNAEWLELELTESLTLDGSENTIQIMRDLKRMGVSLSLDDFGTGWSSLSYLRRFPLDRLKVDRSFMRDVPSQPAAKAIVRSILDLASNLGLSCVGEGVETQQQLSYLQTLSCSEIQGFLFSPAVSATEFSEMLRSETVPKIIAADLPTIA